MCKGEDMNGINKLFDEKLVCVNMGLESFFDAMGDQGLSCAHVEWKPPAGGNPRLIEILSWLED